MVRKWSFVFGDATESILTDSYAVCSLYHSLCDAIKEVDEYEEPNSSMIKFRECMEQLQGIAGAFKEMFQFSIQESNPCDCLIDDVDSTLEHDSETSTHVEEGNRQIVRDTLSRCDITKTLFNRTSISSLVNSSHYVASSNNSFINNDLRLVTRSTYLEQRVPPTELNDEIDSIVNRIYEDLYKKLGRGDCRIHSIVLCVGVSEVSNYFLTLFFTVDKSPRFFIKRVINVEDILDNSLQNNIPKKQVIASLVQQGLSRSSAYRSYQHFNLQDLTREESVKAITYLCMFFEVL